MTIQTPLTNNKFSVISLPVAANQATKKQDPKSATVSIVVPCYNEEKRLDGAEFLQSLVDFPNMRFVFVDDGSKDGTLPMLKNLQAQRPDRIDVVALAKNGGKAEAVRQGLIYATDCGADFVGYWDADLATPLSAIQDFARIAFRFNEVDVIYGSRIQLQGHRINRTLTRRAVSRVCSTMARIALRLPIRDTQCGAKLLRNTQALRSSLQEEFTADWLFDVELFIRLSQRLSDTSRAFYEFPLAEWTEVPGSKVDTKVVVQSGLKMLRLVAESRLPKTRVTLPATPAVNTPVTQAA